LVVVGVEVPNGRVEVSTWLQDVILLGPLAKTRMVFIPLPLPAV
jgi:hypothetical protein